MVMLEWNSKRRMLLVGWFLWISSCKLRAEEVRLCICLRFQIRFTKLRKNIILPKLSELFRSLNFASHTIRNNNFSGEA